MTGYSILSCVWLRPRLAVVALLRLKLDEGLAFLAMCCSSWVPVSRGSTWRSAILPMGNPSFPGVQVANLLGSRFPGLKVSHSQARAFTVVVVETCRNSQVLKTMADYTYIYIYELALALHISDFGTVWPLF